MKGPSSLGSDDLAEVDASKTIFGRFGGLEGSEFLYTIQYRSRQDYKLQFQSQDFAIEFCITI